MHHQAHMKPKYRYSIVMWMVAAIAVAADLVSINRADPIDVLVKTQMNRQEFLVLRLRSSRRKGHQSQGAEFCAHFVNHAYCHPSARKTNESSQADPTAG